MRDSNEIFERSESASDTAAELLRSEAFSRDHNTSRPLGPARSADKSGGNGQIELGNIFHQLGILPTENGAAVGTRVEPLRAPSSRAEQPNRDRERGHSAELPRPADRQFSHNNAEASERPQISPMNLSADGVTLWHSNRETGHFFELSPNGNFALQDSQGQTLEFDIQTMQMSSYGIDGVTTVHRPHVEVAPDGSQRFRYLNGITVVMHSQAEQRTGAPSMILTTPGGLRLSTYGGQNPSISWQHLGRQRR